MLDGLIGFLDQVLMFGYDKLKPLQQQEILFGLPSLYVGLKTFGTRIAQSTTTPYDDQAVREGIQFCENLAEREARQAVLQMKGIDFSK
jgi:hypothetical protein